MSVRVQSLVWEADIEPALKLTLLAYADHANDEGESVYPGEERLVRKTGWSVPTIRRHTSLLISAGLLAQTARGHRGQRASYRVVVEAVKKASHPDTHSEAVESERVSETVERVSLVGGMGITPDTPNTSEPSGTTMKKKERPRDLLWDSFVAVHGDPATRSERGKFNAVLKKLREADVSPEEYPGLVAAFSTKHNGLQPGITTVAERVGELRHFVARGPIQSGTVEDLAEQQEWAALREEYRDDEPNADGRLRG
jgi:hypothetical protein